MLPREYLSEGHSFHICVIVSQGYWNRLPLPGWLKNTKIYSFMLWGLAVQIKVLVGLAPHGASRGAPHSGPSSFLPDHVAPALPTRSRGHVLSCVSSLWCVPRITPFCRVHGVAFRDQLFPKRVSAFTQDPLLNHIFCHLSEHSQVPQALPQNLLGLFSGLQVC